MVLANITNTSLDDHAIVFPELYEIYSHLVLFLVLRRNQCLYQYILVSTYELTLTLGSVGTIELSLKEKSALYK
jgi:hypothetical protein